MSQKGSQFERDVCRQLSLWWSNGTNDDIFWRTQTSGARATVRDKQGKRTFGQYGDVQATDPIGQPLLNNLSIEIKRGYSKSSFADMVEASDTAAIQQFDNFIGQAVRDSRKAGVSFWWLITRRDRKEIWLTIPKTLYMRLSKRDTGLKTSIPKVLVSYHSKALETELRIVMMPFALFLKKVNPIDLRAI